MKSIVGRKMGMTQVFAEDGTMYPVTVVEVLPNVVLQKKTVETDGYEALQVGFEEKKENRCTKPEKGIFAKAGTTPKYEIKELKGDELASYNVGDSITVDLFKAGDAIDVIGTSKGKGYTGAIKRYGFKIGPKGHGSGFHRSSGSMSTNGREGQRIHPGKKMAGHHGDKSATILNLVVVAVDPAKNCMLIKGCVPGPTKSMITIRSAIKAQKAPKVIKPLIDRSAK